MESRKYQLQKQIIEALKAKDDDLYSLLKSQWAHRFGVESLEELNNLDSKQLNQKPANVDNQKIDHSQENSIEINKSISVKDFEKKEKEINKSVIKSMKDEKNQSFKTKQNEIVDEGIYENKSKDNRNQPIVQTLIPLPPKPKYGYLRKWLLGK